MYTYIYTYTYMCVRMYIHINVHTTNQQPGVRLQNAQAAIDQKSPALAKREIKHAAALSLHLQVSEVAPVCDIYFHIYRYIYVYMYIYIYIQI